MTGYVDLHNHVLHDVDDGAPDLEASLDMLRALHDVGFRHVVVTPHQRTAFWEPKRADLESRLQALGEAVREAGIEDLELGLGAENFLDARTFELVEQEEIVTLGGGRHVLVELPTEQTPPALEDMLFQLQIAGLTPVLAHPERYVDLVRKRDRLRGVQERGTLLQVSLTSLGNEGGRRLRKAATRLVKDGLCDLVGTDAHSAEAIERHVPKGLTLLNKLVGEARARSLLTTAPRQVLAS